MQTVAKGVTEGGGEGHEICQKNVRPLLLEGAAFA